MGVKLAASVGCVYWSYDRGKEERMERDERGNGGIIGEGKRGVCN